MCKMWWSHNFLWSRKHNWCIVTVWHFISVGPKHWAVVAAKTQENHANLMLLGLSLYTFWHDIHHAACQLIMGFVWCFKCVVTVAGASVECVECVCFGKCIEIVVVRMCNWAMDGDSDGLGRMPPQFVLGQEWNRQPITRDTRHACTKEHDVRNVNQHQRNSAFKCRNRLTVAIWRE